jgi:hypothetical protein
MRFSKSALILILLAPTPLLFSACNAQALNQALGQSAQNANNASTIGSADLQSTLTKFLALSADQQVSLAKNINSLELLDWTTQNQNAKAEAKTTSAQALFQNKPQLLNLVAARLQNRAGNSIAGPGGPNGMGGSGGQPGGLPPNFAELKSNNPELATELEAMQTLTPEERRTKMDALIQAHPEWQMALAPPQGMGGPNGIGGPNGSPPPGFTPGSSQPPFPIASATPAN